MAAGAYGSPIDFIIAAGEVYDCKVAPEFVAQLPTADYTIADKGYDKEELRAIATQYDKLKRNYATMWPWRVVLCGYQCEW